MNPINDGRITPIPPAYAGGNAHYTNGLPIELKDAVKQFTDRTLEIVKKQSEPPPSLESKVFSPTWTNKPPFVAPVLTVNGQPALTAGNLSVLVAHVGSGKSHLSESILATALNPECAHLGVAACLSDNKKIIYFDTERPNAETWNGWARTMRRAGFYENTVLPENLIYQSLINLTPYERREWAEKVITTSPNSLIIFDGSSDFLLTGNVNDVEDSYETVSWLVRLANENQTGILATVHANPTDAQLKPRGHFGGELLRRAEFVFSLEKLQDGTRRFASDGLFGKHRSGAATAIYFRWNEEHGGFYQCDAPDPKIEKEFEGLKKYEKTVREILTENQTGLTYGELKNELINRMKIGKTTADNKIKLLIEGEVILSKMGVYCLV